LQLELARFRASELAASAEQLPTGRFVAAAVDADANALKSLASTIVSTPGYVAVLVSTSAPALVVVARSQDLPVAANQIIAALTAKFGGRGGGKPDLAQAGGLHAESSEVLSHARTVVLG
jgi:alanyl-tRNA synthetase